MLGFGDIDRTAIAAIAPYREKQSPSCAVHGATVKDALLPIPFEALELAIIGLILIDLILTAGSAIADTVFEELCRLVLSDVAVE